MGIVDGFQMKGMQRPGKIKNVQEKIHAKARNVLQHSIGNFVWARGSGRGEVYGSSEKFNRGEEGAEVRMTLVRAPDSVELGQVTSGSATQD